MILIKNIRLLDPASGTQGQRDICIKGETIFRIGGNLDENELLRQADGQAVSLEVIDGTGLAAAPGLVDAHVHFRDPGFTYKEDITTGAAAAAAGGFTTVVLMANTNPKVDTPETLRYILTKGGQTPIHITSCANVTVGMKGLHLTDMKALLEAGAIGFTDDGVPLLSESLAREAMKQAAALGVPISFHEENPAYIENNGVNHGKASAHFGIGGSDRQAEIDLVERDLKLAEETGAQIVIQHISTKEAVELIRRAKAAHPEKAGCFHAEATPHHFTLTEDAVIRFGSMAKMNPPLREEADRAAIVEGLQDGTIDMIATDHAPHSREEKDRPLTQAPSGIIGLETALALGLEQLVASGRLTLMQLIERMSLAPARLYGLNAGYLAQDGPADLVIFDPEKEWLADHFHSKSCNSPFLGQRMKGKVKYTICRGKIVYQDS